MQALGTALFKIFSFVAYDACLFIFFTVIGLLQSLIAMSTAYALIFFRSKSAAT